MPNKKPAAYRIFALVLVVILALLFTFPLYWIITGSFKTQQAITARVPVWFPVEPTINNYERLQNLSEKKDVELEKAEEEVRAEMMKELEEEMNSEESKPE